MSESRVPELSGQLNSENKKSYWLDDISDDLRDQVTLEAWGFYSSATNNRKDYTPEEMFLDGGRDILPILRSDRESLTVQAFIDGNGMVSKFKIGMPKSQDFISLSGKALEEVVNLYFFEKEKAKE